MHTVAVYHILIVSPGQIPAGPAEVLLKQTPGKRCTSNTTVVVEWLESVMGNLGVLTKSSKSSPSFFPT